MHDSAPTGAPIYKGERNQIKAIPYILTVGSLVIAQTCTRPDISFVVCMLDRYQSDLGMAHW